MIPELIFRTKLHEVSLTIEPINDRVMGLKVREDGVTKAVFELASVYDFIHGTLRDMVSPAQFLGLERRCYEVSNIYKLSREWVEIEEKKEEFPDAHF